MAKNRVGRPRRAHDSEDVQTRGRVLEVAEMLLEKRGYAGVSMDEIAKEVGITKATIYHHFPSGKDALILAVAHQMLGRHQEGIARAVASASSARGQLEAIATWIFSSNGQAEQMLRDAGRFLPESHNSEIFQGFMAGFFVPLERVFQYGMETGEFRPHDVPFMVWTFLSLIAGYDSYRESMPPSELSHAVVGFVLTGIGAPLN